ncbi:unnamed protein product [Parajaminaea phylloscopi]
MTSDEHSENASALEPSLWSQLPDSAFGEVHTPAPSQQSPEHQDTQDHLSRCEGNFDPFDVGAPWTQGQQLPTQVQRHLWLDDFRTGMECVDASQEVRDRHHQDLGSQELLLQCDILAQDGINDQGGCIDSNATASQLPHRWQAEQPAHCSLMAEDILADRPEAAVGPTRPAANAPPSGRQVTVDQGCSGGSPGPSSSSSSSFTVTHVYQASQPRGGLAPMLPQLSPQKRAGYWAQLIDDTAGLIEENWFESTAINTRVEAHGRGHLLQPRTPGPGRFGVMPLHRGNSDSRLLPNRTADPLRDVHTVAGPRRRRRDEDERIEGYEDQRSPLLRRIQMLQGGFDGSVTVTTETRVLTRQTHTVVSPARQRPSHRILPVSAGELTQAQSDAQSFSETTELPAPPGALAQRFPARSRNSVGMGLARKTWATTWRSDGARVVRGRIVNARKSNKGGSAAKGRASSSRGRPANVVT